MPGKYAAKRNCWENFNKACFDSIGEYDIPIIRGSSISHIPELIGFNYVANCKNPESKAVHFFLDDYQFERVWREPEKQLERLKKFKCVCSPDFSKYTDFPKALQIYSHYRKHWLAAYWEKNGIEVIPTIGWGEESSYSWCFDGEPIGGTVAIASIGSQNSERSKALFLQGYKEMINRLNPETIIFYGSVPEGCKGNIVQIKPFYNKFRIARMEMK